jgi:hypothetical protein
MSVAKQTMKKILELTKQEQRVIENCLGTSVSQAVDLLIAAQQWAFENTTPRDFETRFPEFVASRGLTPTLADVATTYVLSWTQTNEEKEVDRRGFELLVSNKPREAWSEADERAWVAFMDSCTEAVEQATESQRLAICNLIDRGTPTTLKEVEEWGPLAHLREWARLSIESAEGA